MLPPGIVGDICVLDIKIILRRKNRGNPKPTYSFALGAIDSFNLRNYGARTFGYC
jgi:hypothetical protein